MPLNLTKVAFGCASLATLERRMESRASGAKVRIVTRMRPKRGEELIGGYLYWIIKHRLQARSEILALEDRKDGRIDIVVSAEVERVAPTPKRAHQGWRYLEEDDAPAAGGDDSGLADLPPRLLNQLAKLMLV